MHGDNDRVTKLTLRPVTAQLRCPGNGEFPFLSRGALLSFVPFSLADCSHQCTPALKMPAEPAEGEGVAGLQLRALQSLCCIPTLAFFFYQGREMTRAARLEAGRDE